MAKSNATNHFYYLSKWAIRVIFNTDDCDGCISLCDLKNSLERAWNDMVDDGEIILEDGKET